MKLLLYLIISSILLTISLILSPVRAVEVGSQSSLKANIPAIGTIHVFGYSAPDSIIQINSVRVFAQTSTDKSGFFEVKEVPISNEALEICFSTIDSDNRLGFPLCLNIAQANKLQEIGPVILSPTLSLSSDLIWQKKIAYATGKTVPNQKVEISIFEITDDSQSNLSTSMWKLFDTAVYAFGLPILNTTSDRNGLYSFTIPTTKASRFRLFAKTIYKDIPTQKSPTLTFAIGSSYKYFLIYFLPWLVFISIFILGIYGVLVYDIRTNNVTRWLDTITEKRLKPFAIRTRLLLRRQLYNFQEWLRSSRK